MSRLRSILELADRHEVAVWGIIKYLKDPNRSWIGRLVVVELMVLLLFNPISATNALLLLPFTRGSLPDWYKPVFWTALALVAAALLIVAWRTAPLKAKSPDYAQRSAIKGLRPFEASDADLFKHLQREGVLRECLQATSARDFRFGVLCGVSGCGKTSFLQAGLLPALQNEPYVHRCIYVKFTNLDPLDTIRQALVNQLTWPGDGIEQDDCRATHVGRAGVRGRRIRSWAALKACSNAISAGHSTRAKPRSGGRLP